MKKLFLAVALTWVGYCAAPDLGVRPSSSWFTNVSWQASAPEALLNLTAPRYVSTLADLAACGTSGPSSIVTLGYAAAGDGGGGLWNRIAAGTYTTNRGSIIDGVGCQWIRPEMFKSEVDIRWFGARSGVNRDNHTAIQAAINAARKWAQAHTNESWVVIPAGDWRLDYQTSDSTTKCVLRVNTFSVGSAPSGVGIVNVRGPGKIWMSLPDWYTNPNTYASPETVVFTNVLHWTDDFIPLTTNTISVSAPWNGKCSGGVFRTAYKVEDLSIDQGYGTTDAPVGLGIKPITGVKTVALGEMSYCPYAIYGTAYGLKIKRCNFSNTPGSFITAACDPVIEDCTFTEWLDHCVYLTSSQTLPILSCNISRCTYMASRATIGVEGDINFVKNTYREANKMRNVPNLTLHGSSMNWAATGADSVWNDSEINASATGAYYGDATNWFLTGNKMLGGYSFYVCYPNRLTNEVGNAGGWISRVSIVNNDIDCEIPVKCDQFPGNGSFLDVRDNVLKSRFAQVQSVVINGDIRWKTGPDITIQQNTVFGNTPRDSFQFGGKMGNVIVSGNIGVPTWDNNSWTNSYASGVRFITSAGNIGSDWFGIEDGMVPPSWDSFVISGNTFKGKPKYFIRFSDEDTWSASKAYTYRNETYADGDILFNATVIYSGTAYTNKAAVGPSASNPSVDTTNWGPLAATTKYIELVDNVRVTDSAGTGSANDIYYVGVPVSGQLIRATGNRMRTVTAATALPTGTLYAPFATTIYGGNLYTYKQSGWRWDAANAAPSAQTLANTSAQVSVSTGDLIEINPGSDLTLISTPNIVAGYEGQVITIYCDDAEANTVTFTDAGTLTNSGLYIGGGETNVVVSAKNSASFIYTGSTWNLINRKRP